MDGCLFLARNLYSRLSTLQCIFCALVVDLRVIALEELLGAIFGLLGPRNIDFLGTLGCFSKNRDFILQDLSKSPRDGEGASVALRPISDRADRELGDQRRVAGKNSQI